MAHYVKVPKDLNEIKEKFILGLTKRQALCFGIGFAIGLPVYFFARQYTPDNALYIMSIAASPAFLCGIYKKNGVYFEKHIQYMIEFFKSPKKRYYRQTNIYQSIEDHLEYIRLKKALAKSEGGNKNGTV